MYKRITICTILLFILLTTVCTAKSSKWIYLGDIYGINNIQNSVYYDDNQLNTKRWHPNNQYDIYEINSVIQLVSKEMGNIKIDYTFYVAVAYLPEARKYMVLKYNFKVNKAWYFNTKENKWKKWKLTKEEKEKYYTGTEKEVANRLVKMYQKDWL